MLNNATALGKQEVELFHRWKTGFGATQLERKYVIRRRFTIAEINAGTDLLPAIPGYKYRMVNAKLIAVGGAVGATTTVDILATQGGASVKLLAVAIAALAQSAVVRDGATNATVLANGASYVANDVNTKLSVGKTGATATTATHVDVIFEFSMDEG
jgi:hypothetical protein